MNGIALVFFFLGLAAGAFGVWGTLTEAGRERFPGGSQSLPFYSLIAALVLVGTARVMGLLKQRARKRQREDEEQ